MEFLDRICDECNEVEDEYHVLFKCTRFHDLRKKYIQHSLVQNPSMYEFIKLINSKDHGKVRRLGIFFHKAFNEYDSCYM